MAHPDLASRLSNLAQLLQATNRLGEAEPLYRRALAIDEKSLGPEHPNLAAELSNLAQLHADTNRLSEAEPLMRRALAIDEKSLGVEHPTVATQLNNLAGLLQHADRLGEAEPLFRRALAIDEKGLGPEHPDVAIRLNNLATIRAELGDWTEAAQLSRRAIPIMTAAHFPVADHNDLAKSTVNSNAVNFLPAVRAIYRADARGAGTREEGFEVAQWALQSAAADAVALMSARQAKGAGPLAELVRQHEDLISRRRAADKRLLAAVGEGNAAQTDADRAAVRSLDRELDATDKRLGDEFPEYASFSNPKPLDLAVTQALVHEDEALILFLDVPKIGSLPADGLAWSVTKTDSRWVHSDLGGMALTARVFALRCGLDSSNWVDVSKLSDTTEDAKQQKKQANSTARSLQAADGR